MDNMNKTIYKQLKVRDKSAALDAKRVASLCMDEGRLDLAHGIYCALTQDHFNEVFNAAGSFLIRIGKSW